MTPDDKPDDELADFEAIVAAALKVDPEGITGQSAGKGTKGEGRSTAEPRKRNQPGPHEDRAGSRNPS